MCVVATFPSAHIQHIAALAFQGSLHHAAICGDEEELSWLPAVHKAPAFPSNASGQRLLTSIAAMFILTSAGSCLASVAAVCACQACQGITREVLRKSARLAYCTLFTTAMVLAWVLRDFSKPLIEKIPCKASSSLLRSSFSCLVCSLSH